MASTNHVTETFEKIDFTEKPLARGEYEECIFLQCNFSDSDLSNIHFYDCSFRGCNLSLAALSNNTMSDVKFRDCKLLGLHFELCNPIMFSVSFEKCILNLSSFYNLKMKKTIFLECSLRECDFTGLLGARFDSTTLEKADLRWAKNFAIDPEMNKITKAKFSKEGVMGLLYKWDIVIE